MMISWLIEHTLLILPTWFWFATAGVGAVLYFFSGFISAIPFAQARVAGVSIRYIGLAVLLGGVYLTGGAGVTALWQAEIKQANEKIAAAEQQAENVNTALKEKIVTKIQIVKEKVDANSQAIEAKRDQINADCRLSDDAWVLYNRAVKNEVARSTSGTTATSR
jgi:lipopolysaccharide export LptBFGC system permease protein LptF